MKKRILCLLSIIIIVPTLLFGCGVEEESSDVNIISDETVKFGALLPATDNTGKEIEAGLNYAYSLASSVNIGNKIDVDFVTEYYSNNEEVESKAKELVDSSVSAIVFYTDKLDCFNIFNDYIGETKVPVISLSPFTSDNENIFTISLTPKHLSSCAATYALENSYNNCAILLSRSDEFFENFAETYKNTLFSYVGFEPTVYYKEGEFANFSSSLLVSGNYEYLFLICSADEREDIVSNIMESGFVGEIMLTEVFDKSNIKSDLFIYV